MDIHLPGSDLPRSSKLNLLAFIVLAGVPFIYHQDYFLHVMSLALIMAVAALAMQLVLGFSGQLSMGQAAFMGIGAYTSAILTKDYGLPFVLAFLAAGALSGFASLALVPITRLRGVYLAIGTLGFGIVIHLILLNEEWLTGGSFGFLKVPWPAIGPVPIANEFSFYLLCLAVMGAVYFALSRIVDSRFGRALQAIMLDEDAARASGINVTLCLSKCFVIAAMVTGLAGSLLAHHTRYLNPSDFTLWKSIEILIMVAVGGIGSLPGAIIGAFVVVLLPEYLRALDEWRLVIYGVLLVLLMGLGRGGMAALLEAAFRRVADMLGGKAVK